MTAGARFVGQRVARREDARFLTGRGQYVDDLTLPGTLHVAFARSDVARGRITSVDTTAAAAVPGVVAVLVASDLDRLTGEHFVDGESPDLGYTRPFCVLADGDVRFVGDPMAMVVAESRYIAEDAVDALDIVVDPEDPVIDPGRALEDGAPLVHPGSSSNLLYELPGGDTGPFDDAIASAPVVVTETFRQHRYATVPLETRGILASWDPGAGELSVWTSTQGPHGARLYLARLLGIDDSQVRVVMPDVGGSFGLKMHPSREEIAVVLATRILGRPVKWIQDRRENLMSDHHAREDDVTMTVAVDDEGTILALKAEFVESCGAYPAAFSSATPFTTMIFPGPYRVPACAASARTVHTNTAGRGSYRGPWMIETVGREQVLDRVAARLGMDPLDLRRRNVIGEHELPYALPTGVFYDQMTAAATLEQAAELIGYEHLREQQKAWRAEGRLVGIGVSLLAEPSAMAFGWMATDGATVRIGPNGRADVLTSAAGHGQSLETTIAQVVADELGIDVSHVRVLQGDTDAAPTGPGTGGSRSAVIAGGAAQQAALEVRTRMIAIAANELEASPGDLEIVDGHIHVVGTPARGVTVADVARKAYYEPSNLPAGQAPGLEGHARYTPGSPVTWSNACHICQVEVDRETGKVGILRYVVSEDCGVMINPNVVEGQIAGGVVQGIGGVLYEHMAYDDAGNPLTTTFMDYLLPTATEVPVIEYGHIETP
ncbi:MAG TPA: xanthine dehydrogenase family protein molybdopterin-binding subunit, partial [Acidimicrobiales bacterium]|nr:xanthine dehydrogenase family protein molybdopterin-binding subunit [Acidimicrobiales bacterium]